MAQISYAPDDLHKDMLHSVCTGKLLAEMPHIYKLMAELKEAKSGTPKASAIHHKIKNHLQSVSDGLLEGKVELEQQAKKVKRTAREVHTTSVKIGRLDVSKSKIRLNGKNFLNVSPFLPFMS